MRMKKSIYIVFAVACAFALSACCTKNEPAAANSACKADEGWQPLFKPDLSNAVFDAGIWSFDNGILKATQDKVIFTKADYSNFELELEFKIEKGSNSGIVVYCTDIQKWIPNSVEIQIADSSDPRFAKPTWRCGSIFGHVDAEFDTRLSFGEWHKMRVVCKGPVIEAWLDGKHVSKIDMLMWTDNKVGPDGTQILPWLTEHKKCEMATRGRIGLQGKHGKAATDFRNMRLRVCE